MKKIILLSLLLSALHSTPQTKPGTFIINGTIMGKNSGHIKLAYTGDDGKPKKDSAIVKDGNFVFKGTLSSPAMAFLMGDMQSRGDDDPNSTSFFLEPAVISISVKVNDFKKAVIQGSESQHELAEQEKMLEPVLQQMQLLNEAYNRDNNAYIQARNNKAPDAVLDSMKEKLADLHNQFDPYQQQIAALNYSFFESHPRSYVTAYNLRYYTSSLPLDTLQMYYNNLGPVVQQSNSARAIAKEIEQLRSGSPGSMAKDFVAKDINKNDLALSAFKGKYVLLDFWASWCVPCRHSSPHLLELYKQYHDRGFDIIGIADDDNKPDEWKKAVAKDNVGVWHHVLRGLDWKKFENGEDNPADISNKFGVHSLPTKILIDKNGVIIGRYDKGTDEEVAAMDKKIAEALK
jgi:thiol-disulfide isomerase/thioredoxin